MKTGGNFSPHRGADIFRFRPILCLLKRWDYLFRDWNCSYTLKQIDNADKFIRAIEEYMSRIWPAAVHHPFIMSIEYSPLWNSDTHRQRTGNPDVSRGLGFGRCLSSPHAFIPGVSCVRVTSSLPEWCTPKICTRKAQTLSGLFVSRARSRREWLAVDIWN